MYQITRGTSHTCSECSWLCYFWGVAGDISEALSCLSAYGPCRGALVAGDLAYARGRRPESSDEMSGPAAHAEHAGTVRTMAVSSATAVLLLVRFSSWTTSEAGRQIFISHVE